MKIKMLLMALSVNLLFQSLSAQNIDSTGSSGIRFQGQLGFDATTFLKQFIVLNNTAPTPTPFNYNGKFLVGITLFPKLMMGPRAGFGYNTTHTYSNNETQSNERSDDTKNRSIRIGMELQQKISSRWLVYYGFDYINGINNASTVTTSQVFNPNPPFGTMSVRTEILNNDKFFGFGPVVGVQFNINKWMCLSTETSFYSTQTRGGTKVISSNPNNTVPETFNDSKSTSITLPFFVNFNIVF